MLSSTIIVLLFSLVLLAIIGNVQSLQLQPKASITNRVSTKFRLNSPLLAKKSTKVDESSKYWQGDWVCADCGYVYDKDIDGGGQYFEEMKKGFICPQCSAPRKRYAKKVGDEWGVTRDGGDFPIYALTFVGLIATAWFALVYVPSL